MKFSLLYKFVFLMIFLLATASPVSATTGGNFEFKSTFFSLQLLHAYGTPGLESEKYINDGYLAYKYASFLFRKQLFDRSFRNRYQAEPLLIEFEIGVSDGYGNFSSPSDWETNPYVFKNVAEVYALPTPKIFTLQLVIYRSPLWLNTFKAEFGHKLREISPAELCENVDFGFFVDGCDNKKHPVYVINNERNDGTVDYYVRYGMFLSFEDARKVAQKLSRDLGFEVQILERKLTRDLIRKVLFDTSFVI